MKGVPVKFKHDEDEYFAVIKEVSGVEDHFGRNVLYVFDSRAKLIYQRVFQQKYVDKAIAAVNLDDSGTESLLVAGEGKVWQYKFKN
ncbi:MAG: hypothetical protein ABII74_10435 [Elusimicrobiota bacterium]